MNPGSPVGYYEAWEKNRCMACAKEGAFEGGICDPCKALIRGEALEQQHQIKKDADRSLHKEGTDIEKKPREDPSRRGRTLSTQPCGFTTRNVPP